MLYLWKWQNNFQSLEHSLCIHQRTTVGEKECEHPRLWRIRVRYCHWKPILTPQQLKYRPPGVAQGQQNQPLHQTVFLGGQEVHGLPAEVAGQGRDHQTWLAALNLQTVPQCSLVQLVPNCCCMPAGPCRGRLHLEDNVRMHLTTGGCRPRFDTWLWIRKLVLQE